MSYPRFQRARDFKMVRKVSADTTLNSTSWANVDTGLDLTLKCQVGDVVMAVLNAICNAVASPDVRMDVVTVVAGTPVNSFYKAGTAPSGSGASDTGLGSWYLSPTASTTPAIGAPALYAVVAGDIVGGYVTFRLRYATGAAANRTLYSSATAPLTFSVHNLGPADPN